MSSKLCELAWKPVVVTVDPQHYEETNDEASLALLPHNLQVERVGAWPARFCRPLGIGDVSIRGQWTMRSKVRELVNRGNVDLVFATVLPGYTSLIGAWAKRKLGLPFVLDYQDPWVSDWSAKQPRLSKAGLSHWLARNLEPGAVAAADALTAVSGQTLNSLRVRHLLKTGVPTETIPIGADPNDHDVARRVGRSWIRRDPDEFVLAYTGTIIEGMLPCVRTLFRSVRALTDANPSPRILIHFIGTSADPSGKDALGLMGLAEELGVGRVFRLEPRRIGYLDALRSMQDADALLLLGSRASHYTASKLFPCWLSGKPVLALFHAASTVNELAAELGGVHLVKYDNQEGPETRVDETARVLRQLIEHDSVALRPRNQSAFEPYSSRGTAQRYAALFDRVVAERGLMRRP
ncbi:MAG: glycosyltransferase [Verrucomicrobia bacterium]|nr:glycosyltransferase [Verrucomicrobiota bacterium]